MSSKPPVMSHDPLADVAEESPETVAAGSGDAASEADGAEVIATPELGEVEASKDAPTSAAGSDDSVLVLEESLTIADVGDLKIRFEPMLSRETALEIDGREVDSVDGAGLQLLATLVKELVGKSVEVRWLGASESLSRAAQQVGLEELLKLPSSEKAA